jgi:serine/threonine protein kinase
MPLICPNCESPIPPGKQSAGGAVDCPTCGTRLVASKPVGVAAPSSRGKGIDKPLPGAPTVTAPAATGSSSEDGTLPPSPASPPVDSTLYDFLAPPQKPDEIGRLGPYRVLKVLGHGGMGVVYLAEDPQLNRPIALKVMLPAMASSPASQQRFLREARAAAMIEHDHVITIYQVGEDRGVPYLAMPLLKGESLDDRLRREGQLPPATVIRLGREIAEGLAAAHERGLIHRDIKPSNIWLEGDRGRVKILDFGLARGTNDNVQLTQTGAILGTPAFMAPEQASGLPVDARSDLFSLGCVLYRMCAGRLPFQGKDTISTLIAVTTEEPPALASLNPALPPQLDRLIKLLLEKDPNKRPASARAVAKALVGLAAKRPQAPAATPSKPPAAVKPSPGKPAASRSTPPTEKLQFAEPSFEVPEPPRKRHGLFLMLLLLFAALAVAGYFAASFLLQTQDRKPGAGSLPNEGTRVGKVTFKTQWVDVGVQVLLDGKKVQELKNDQTAELEPGMYRFKLLDERKPAARQTKLGVEPPQLLVKEGEQYLLALRVEAELARTLRHPAILRGAAFSPDSRFLLTGGGGNDHTLRLWGVESGKLLSEVSKHTQPISSIAFSPSGLFALTGSWDKTLKRWKVEGGVLTALQPYEGHTDQVNSVAYSPNGYYGLSGSKDRTVRLWDLASGKEINRFPRHKAPVLSVAFSQDGNYAASSDASGTVWLLRVDHARNKLSEVRILEKTGSEPITSLAFSPDDGRIAAVQFRTARFWDRASGKELKQLAVERKWDLHSIAWLPDGYRVIVGGGGGQVEVREVQTAKVIASLSDHKATVLCVASALDGRHLVSVGADKSALLWLLPRNP